MARDKTDFLGHDNYTKDHVHLLGLTFSSRQWEITERTTYSDSFFRNNTWQLCRQWDGGRQDQAQGGLRVIQTINDECWNHAVGTVEGLFTVSVVSDRC